MNTNGHELLYKEEVFKITGCAMEVLNELGHGLLEKPYENALVVEFGLRGIPIRQQPRYEVRYKDVIVGDDELPQDNRITLGAHTQLQACQTRMVACHPLIRVPSCAFVV